MIKSYTVNRDGDFTLIAIFAHSGSKGEWYMTPVKITESPSTLSDKAKEWITRNIK